MTGLVLGRQTIAGGGVAARARRGRAPCAASIGKSIDINLAWPNLAIV